MSQCYAQKRLRSAKQGNHLNDYTLALESETVFLRVILDVSLSWKPHIAYLASKISRSLGVISESSFYLYKFALLTLNFSLV